MEYEVSLNNERLVVKEKGKKYEIDLRERVFRFAVDTIKFLMTLPYKKEFDVIRYQLSKSATSVGANYSPGQMLHRSKPDIPGLFDWVNPVK